LGLHRFWFAANDRPHRRCCSSEVEHSLGKGEVESSILSSSTINLDNILICIGFLANQAEA
jgi:hypothetical protein